MSSRFSAVIAGLCILGPGSAFAADSAGRVTNIKGVVLLNRVSAIEGQALAVGSVVETKQGKCTLLLGPETVMHLDVDSRLKITEHMLEEGGAKEKTGVELDFGRTRALLRNKGPVQKSFNIKSRNAVMGIRGTHVYIDSPRDLKVPQSFLTVEGAAQLSFAAPKTTKTNEPKAPGAGTAASGAAAVAQEPAVRTIILKKNEFFQASEGADLKQVQVTQLPPSTIRQMVDQVALPPKEIKSAEEVHEKNTPRAGPEKPEQGARPERPEAALPQLPPITAPKFDPVANGGGNPIKTRVKVTIQIQKQ